MKLTTDDIVKATDAKIFRMMDDELVKELGAFIREFNRREWMVRIAKQCSFSEYYSQGRDNPHKEDFAHGFQVNGNPVPYFHPNRSFHDEIIWLNNNLFYDESVSFEDKLLNSAIVKFYGPSATLKVIVDGTDWKYINFDRFNKNDKYAHKLMSNIEAAKLDGQRLWGTTELRTSLQTASRNYARTMPSLIDMQGSLCGRVDSMSESDVTSRKMRPSDMIHWIDYLSREWIPFYKTKPNMEESFNFLTKTRGIGDYYGYHFSSNLARMPGIGAASLIGAEYADEFAKLGIEHGNLDEDAEYVVAGPGSSKTIKRLIPDMPMNQKTTNRVLLAIRDNQYNFFGINEDMAAMRHLKEASELGRYTMFGCEISCCQFNVFAQCKDNYKLASKRSKAPISVEAGQDDKNICTLEDFFS